MASGSAADAPHGRLAFVRRLLMEAAPPPLEPGVARITALVPDPSRAGAVRVVVDGAPLATVAREDLAGIAIGTAADEAIRARLLAAADVEGALRAGLAALGRRGFAAADLARRLRRKGNTAEAATGAVRRLQSMGLLDDDAFARSYAEQAGRKGRGPARVARDLGVMGVDRARIEAAIAAAGLREAFAAEGGNLRELAAARLARLGNLEPTAARRRLLAWLARRGFRGAAVQRMVRELTAERTDS